MKKHLLLYGFCLFFASFLKADEFVNKHGIGTIHVPLDSLGTLDLWESPDDKAPMHSIVTTRELLYPTLNHLTFDQLKRDSVPSWFTPLVFFVNIENCRLDFNCLEETKLYYKTNLKCESGKYLWIQKTEEIKFVPWLSFYKSLMGLYYVNDTVAIYEKPTTESMRFNFNISDASHRIELIPVEIKGSWMKVELYETGLDEEKKEMKYGWIRWRDEKDPLIKFNLMGC